MQNEARQKEIEAKRAAAKAALVEARVGGVNVWDVMFMDLQASSFDLQLPTDKVLAFEASLWKCVITTDAPIEPASKAAPVVCA